MENKIEFMDAQALHKQHPGTFDAPTAEELQQLKPGDFVKICAMNERFWAEVISVDTEIITARVDNNLIMDELHYNDSISFKKENIYDILKPPPLKHRPNVSKPLKRKIDKKHGKGL